MSLIILTDIYCYSKWTKDHLPYSSFAHVITALSSTCYTEIHLMNRLFTYLFHSKGWELQVTNYHWADMCELGYQPHGIPLNMIGNSAVQLQTCDEHISSVTPYHDQPRLALNTLPLHHHKEIKQFCGI